MGIAFFVSSIGDTDLAKATLSKLKEQNSTEIMIVVPLTLTAINRTEDIMVSDKIFRYSIDQIMQQPSASRNELSLEELEKVKDFIKKYNIQHAYIGVPSDNNEIPFQIALNLDISCTIAFEYMFKPVKHTLWNYIDRLVAKVNCNLAVPLKTAKKDIIEMNNNAEVYKIGHLSIDRSQIISSLNVTSIRQSLSINSKEELVFISGTSQPVEVDNQFLNALLEEISTGKYQNLQLRMGLHPGIKDPDAYLKTILETCEKHFPAKEQFKIIITSEFEKKLKHPIVSNSFILHADLSGVEIGEAADKVAQAVPGALLNEAALKGKPSYFHDTSAIPYLPQKWFAKTLVTFFKAKRELVHSREELGLKASAPDLLAKLILK